MTETTTTPHETTPPPLRLGYQPALDGVRAIAVSLVVLYHYPWRTGINGAGHGGFLGVDVFFVLSGFLITTLLLQEHAAHGAVSLRHFYARRALRLLPAFAVLWAIALVLHFTLASHDGFAPRTIGLLGTLFYAGNWVQIYHPNMLGVLLPTWSLAIEEQFYLVWPVILIFMLHLRLKRRTIAAITGAGAVAAALHRASYWHHYVVSANFVNYYFRVTARHVSSHAAGTFKHQTAVWDRVYFGSDTRADTLLVGCFTAIVLVWLLPRLHARSRMWLSSAAAVAFIGAGVIVSRAFYIRSGWLPRWGLAALELCVAVVIVGLVAAPRAPFARLLSFPPLVWVGSRSYAIYLFNFVVFHYCNRTRVHLSPSLSFVFQMAMILVAAELSYRLVEAPMLKRKRRFAPETAEPASTG